MRRLLLVLLLAALTAAAWLIFDRYLFHVRNNDHLVHAKLAMHALGRRGYPPHFLYHWLLNALTGFSGDDRSLRLAAEWVLSGSVLARLVLSRRLAQRWSPGTLGFGAQAWIVVVVFLAAPIVSWWNFPRVYFGQFSPTVWHNPTIIFLMPFALGVLMLADPGRERSTNATVFGSLLLGISTFAKPSFALVFLPAMAVLTLLRSYRLKELIAYAVPTVGALAWLYVRGYDQRSSSRIVLDPLHVWTEFTDHPWSALLVSFAFPAAVLVCYWESLRNPAVMLLAWTMVIVGLAQFLLFAETGDRLLHGNFFWGTVPAMAVLFLVSTVEWLAQRPRSRATASRVRYVLCGALLLAHVASGALFAVRSWMGYSYLA